MAGQEEPLIQKCDFNVRELSVTFRDSSGSPLLDPITLDNYPAMFVLIEEKFKNPKDKWIIENSIQTLNNMRIHSHE